MSVNLLSVDISEGTWRGHRSPLCGCRFAGLEDEERRGRCCLCSAGLTLGSAVSVRGTAAAMASDSKYRRLLTVWPPLMSLSPVAEPGMDAVFRLSPCFLFWGGWLTESDRMCRPVYALFTNTVDFQHFSRIIDIWMSLFVSKQRNVHDVPSVFLQAQSVLCSLESW